MEVAILGSILVLRIVQSITGKSCSKYAPKESRGMLLYMSIRMGLSAAFAVIALWIGGISWEMISDISGMGWWIAIATGAALTISSCCSLLAMQGASVALSSLFSTAGLLVPTLSGIVLFDQQVSWGQWMGIGCLFCAAVLLASSSKITNGKITLKTFLLLVGSMLANGSTMLLQTLYKAWVPEGNVSLYSFLQFGIPAIALLLASLGWKKRDNADCPKIEKNLLGYTILASAAVFGISQISTLASAFIPGAVLFPISDGGHTIIAAIVAAVLFKEKLTVRSVCGVMIGVAGLVMIKLLSGT